MNKLKKVLSHPVTDVVAGLGIITVVFFLSLPYEAAGELHIPSGLFGAFFAIGADIFGDGIERFFSKKDK